MSVFQILTLFALVAGQSLAQKKIKSNFSQGLWEKYKITDLPNLSKTMDDKLDEGSVVLFSYGQWDDAVRSTVFFYDSGRSGFINTTENLERCALENVTRVWDRKKMFTVPELYNLVIQEVFRVVCNPANKVCCRQTREHQTSCSSLATASWRRSNIANEDGQFLQLLTDSTSFDWLYCRLAGNRGFVDCRLDIIEQYKSEFTPNEFGEQALSIKDHGLLNVDLLGEEHLVRESDVARCGNQIGKID